MAGSIVTDVVANAEKKARLRDYEKSKVLTDDELALASELQAKAQARGMLLIPEKKYDKVKFVQLLQKNWLYLNQNEYLSGEQRLFILDLIPYIHFGSNAIVEDITKKQPVALNQTGLANVLNRDKSRVAKIINSLVKKGVIAKSNAGLENNNARSYVLFLNPHIVYSGDRQGVNETLQLMFAKPMTMDILNKIPERLF